MPRIIIIHYHLNPGGVTRIIESQVQCLMEQNKGYDIVVMCGDVAQPEKIEKFGASLVVDPQLNYLPENLIDYKSRLTELQCLLQVYIQPTDLIHFHNMNLGKNPLMTIAFSQMAVNGYKVLNHAHDFAEDRPVNMAFLSRIIVEEFGLSLEDTLYPNIPNYLFATLNSFDRNRLADYAVEPKRAFLLPNPVALSKPAIEKQNKGLKPKICKSLEIDATKLLITYPVRVIQRKNIGEYILLCTLFSDIANWVVTQPPKNPTEIIQYEQWKAFCLAEEIPLVFEAGHKADFEELVQASDWCFTTSIREGFGMVYMEPWLMHTPVGGRNLQYITSDLTQSGIIFPLLYNQLWVDQDGKKIDFGELSSEQQRNIIRNLNNSEAGSRELLELNPVLKMITDSVKEEVISNNQSIILTEYSLSTYAKRIEGIYRKLIG